ncbi:thioredoxin-like protein [Nitzschia inconspicua]|uniref:Thioredoxin-like protein n=1 Tax=Nitzschia inconspicua TaxID=303405 RepID=A0A9K3KEA1_9STRA|nr:thioredoxin-like protein [Nitzschia inconspicua]
MYRIPTSCFLFLGQQLLIVVLVCSVECEAFVVPTTIVSKQYDFRYRLSHPTSPQQLLAVSNDDNNGPIEDATTTTNSTTATTTTTTVSDAVSPAPVLNGKRVLPIKVMMAGLKGQKEVAASYAIFGPEYKQTEWKACLHVGITRNLQETLQTHMDDTKDSNNNNNNNNNNIAFVRALSFIIPNEGAMESIAAEWRKEAIQAGGKTNFDPVLAAMEQDFDEDDDDDDDDEDDYFDMMAGAMSASRSDLASARGIVEPEPTQKEVVSSPFDQPAAYAITSDGQSLDFTKENVDKVLEEIRPYLISDGGNVSVERVDEEKRNVYLKLEGACGSCPSSTVTMQMGIERVLKENFTNLGQVLQVEDDKEDKPKELTYQAVEQEVNRIKPAIIAMGGLVDIVSVDPIGVVELKFRGANKVKTGLELALLDIDFVKHVKFVMDE